MRNLAITRTTTLATVFLVASCVIATQTQAQGASACGAPGSVSAEHVRSSAGAGRVTGVVPGSGERRVIIVPVRGTDAPAKSATTSASGAFDLGKVFAGRYFVVFEAPRADPVWSEINVGPDSVHLCITPRTDGVRSAVPVSPYGRVSVPNADSLAVAEAVGRRFGASRTNDSDEFAVLGGFAWMNAARKGVATAMGRPSISSAPPTAQFYHTVTFGWIAFASRDTAAVGYSLAGCYPAGHKYQNTGQYLVVRTASGSWFAMLAHPQLFADGYC